MLHTQVITLDLDGITAGDYAAHFVDGDPALEATRIRSVAMDFEPLGDRVVAVLRWDGTPAPAATAARAAGFQLTGDVVAVSAEVEAPARRRPRRERAALALAAAL